MIEFRKFPSIEQFRNVIKQVLSNAKYNNTPIPTLKFTGTVKLHGTNSAVGFNPENKEVIYQSRERILSLQQDNAGFMMWASGSENIKNLINTLNDKFKPKQSLYIYGEWAGGSIQKKVALNALPKMFYIFDIVIDDFSIDLDLVDIEYDDIHNINKFGKWDIEINFNRPQEVQNQLVEWTIAVEDECPVGKHFGVSGIGEGLVYKNLEHNLLFKVKGEKHANSKVTKLKEIAPIDVEKMNSLKDFIDSVCSESRLNQGLDKLKENNLDHTDNKNIGEYIKWVVNDIFKEESDTIVANQFEAKKIGGLVANKARQFYLNQPL